MKKPSMGNSVVGVVEKFEILETPWEELVGFRRPSFPCLQTLGKYLAAASVLTTTRTQKWPFLPPFRVHLAYLALQAPQDHREL